MGIWRCFNRIEKLHITDVVKVYLVLQYDNQPFPIQSYGQDSGRKGELAYR